MSSLNPPVCAGCQRHLGILGGGHQSPLNGGNGSGYGGGGNDSLPIISALNVIGLALKDIDVSLKIIVERGGPLADPGMVDAVTHKSPMERVEQEAAASRSSSSASS